MKNTITKENFKAYIKVQRSGVTNMFDIKTVSTLSGLDKVQIIDIMSNYTEYIHNCAVEQWPAR